MRKSPSLISENYQPALSGNDRPKFIHSCICPSLARIPSMLFGLGMLMISLAFGQQIDNTEPANASHTAQLGTKVTATASATVTSAPAGSFVVFRSKTAARTAVDALASDSTVVTLDPSGDFHPGEVIQATVTDDVTAPTAVTPYVWSFRTRVMVGIGVFTDSGNSLGSNSSSGVSLGDVDGDGDLDASVLNGSGQANRVWLNDGSGVFTDSGSTFGSDASTGVSLGDVDGDLDAIVSNYYGQANRVWLNTNLDSDEDGIDNYLDGTPNDDDTDDEGQKDGVDDDIDGDGLLNTEEVTVGTDAFDPDTDDDGILDSRDRYPLPGDDANALGECGGAVSTIVTAEIIGPMTCVATTRIETVNPGPVVVDGDDFVNGPGDLLLISPTVMLNPGFAVEPDGKLTVISADPSLPPP